MNRDDEVFKALYPGFKALYDESVQLGYKPIEIFGIMLGIIAQQYQMYSSKEEFQDFLTVIQNQPWPGERKQKGKPDLKLVH